MKYLRNDWNTFWFKPTSPVTLGLFRMVYGFWAFAYGALLFPERFTWFSNRGVLTQAEAAFYNGGTGGPWWQHQNGLLLLPGADHWLTLFFLAYLLAALCLTVGFGSRISAALVYAGICALHARDAPIHNSGDTVMVILAAYLILSPCGAACSIDRLRRIFRGTEDDTPPLIVPWAQRIMQLQITVLYLCAGLSKATGAAWQDGTAVYYPMHLPESLRFPTWGQDNLYVINLITWGTVAIEMALGTIVWVPRLRLYVLAAGVALHLGIEYSMNIPFFSAMMITSYINFLKPAEVASFLEWAKRPLGLTPLRLVYDGHCDFCKSCLLVVRFLDVFRQITFVDSHDPEALATTGVRFEDAEEAAYAVRPDGRQYAGFDAFRQVAWHLPATALLAPLLYIPGIPQGGRRAYTWIKNNRSRLPVAPRYKVKPMDKPRKTAEA
jgi:predicted DCC family thiol-disulfide oxidoreductase YuxK